MHIVAITGITGKSGQYFLQRLLDHADQLSDYYFKLICRKEGPYSVNTAGYKMVNETLKYKKINVELCEVDLRNSADLEKVFVDEFGNKTEMLLHIASIKLSWDIVSVALKYGVDNFILVHTTGIYSKYKEAGEAYRQIESKIYSLVKHYRNQGRRVAITILRPTMIYGDLEDRNISTFIKMVDKLRIFPVVNGARYDLQPVWCKDLGNAYYDVLMNWDVTKNKEYILSGGAPIQLREIFIEIARQLGVKNTFVSCPFPIAYLGAWVIYVFSLKRIDYREKVQRLVEPRTYGHEAATRDFGYDPVEFSIGVVQEVEMYKKSKK